VKPSNLAFQIQGKTVEQKSSYFKTKLKIMKLFSNSIILNLWLALVLVFSSMIYAQTPGIPYQAYIENTNAGYVPGEQLKNIPLSNTDIMLEFTILDDTDNEEYTEIISVTTDPYGLVSTVVGIGYGTITHGSFSGITWDGTKKTLRTRIDFTNTGNNFEDHGEIILYYMPSPSKIVTQGLSTGTGAPTATSPADAEAGDIYVDEATGNIYSHDGTSWVDSSASNSTGTGAPTATNPANPEAGDIYVDETTGDIYTYDGSDWVSQSEIVSADTGNIIKEDTKGLAFLDKDTLAGTLGLSSGTGAPTTTSPADPEAGDIYVDETTGDIYTYDGSDWTRQPEAKISTGTGAPTATSPADAEAGDIYVDETTGDIYTYNSTDDAWQKQIADADNGLTNNSGTIELGGALTKATEIETTNTNTLAITGLQDADDTSPEDYAFLAIDKTTGVIHKTSTASAKQLVVSYTAARGDDEFDTPKNILELDNVDAYRNGVRIDFVQVDANTIKLDLAEIDGCYTGDEIRIVQLQ
jgi:hypothetical protein